jgi:hypothetical protein
MSTLVVDRLLSSFTQPITANRDIFCLAIRAKLYVHNIPSGTFSFKVYKGVSLVASTQFSSADLKSKIGSSLNYFWGDFAFPVSFFLERGEYVIRLESSGYTFGETSFIGWAKDYDSVPTNIDGDPEDFSEYPFSFNLVESVGREVIK